MPKRITKEQRQAVLRLLAEGQDRDTIAAAVGVTPGQVSAVAAHVKMGTYALPDPGVRADADEDAPAAARPATDRTMNLLQRLQQLEGAKGRDARINPVLLGADAETGEKVYYNPDQASGAPNPHVLIMGESGIGKTYAISCLTAELAHEGVVSIVFDYGQGFSPKSLPREFVAATNPVEVHVGRDGVDINPLQLFPSDLHGPVNVAQRVADTFGRVYKKIGEQQHAILRQAVLDVMADAGIRADAPDDWSADLPAFGEVQVKLNDLAANTQNAQAASPPQPPRTFPRCSSSTPSGPAAKSWLGRTCSVPATGWSSFSSRAWNTRWSGR